MACHIPKLNISGSEAVGFFHHVDTLDCDSNYTWNLMKKDYVIGECLGDDREKCLEAAGCTNENYFHPRQFTLRYNVESQKLNESGAVGNALVIVMVDHGHRFAKFRAIHHQGIEMHRYTCLNWESAMNDGKQANVSMMLSKAVVQSSHAKSQRRLCTPLKLICHCIHKDLFENQVSNVV
ncbi:hypothetical protein DINM_021205 [Dirofilaria immitis]|nr:hypothetical protein [Dirofilaria immitis]